MLYERPEKEWNTKQQQPFISMGTVIVVEKGEREDEESQVVPRSDKFFCWGGPGPQMATKAQTFRADSSRHCTA